MLLYCFPANWIVGKRGWLKQLGVVDLSGAGTLFTFGGFSGILKNVLHYLYLPLIFLKLNMDVRGCSQMTSSFWGAGGVCQIMTDDDIGG